MSQARASSTPAPVAEAAKYQARYLTLQLDGLGPGRVTKSMAKHGD